MTKKKQKSQLPEQEQKEEKYWSITLGLYPGLLFGFRTYEEPEYDTHVFYLPFIDIALEIEK